MAPVIPMIGSALGALGSVAAPAVAAASQALPAVAGVVSNPLVQAAKGVYDMTQPGGAISQAEQMVTGGKGWESEAAKGLTQGIQGGMQNAANQQAYQDYLKRTQGVGAEGERGFLESTATALPELEQMRQDLRKGTQQEMQQAAKEGMAQFARQGVRGPQASTILSRQQGNIAQKGMEDVNKLAYEEAMGRRGARQQYYAGKAGRGEQAGLNIQPRYV